MDIAPLPLLVLMAALALLPMMVGLCTCFLKVQVVVGVLRNALGTSQFPGGVACLALSLGISARIMAPVLERSFDAAKNLDLRSIEVGSLSGIKKLWPVAEPWVGFMRTHAGEREAQLLLHDFAASAASPKGDAVVVGQADWREALPVSVVVPAFLLSELREALLMACGILLPFLAIDLLVSNILAGVGLAMVSPALVALPLKLFIFVQSDALLLIVRGLVHSYSQ